MASNQRCDFATIREIKFDFFLDSNNNNNKYTNVLMNVNNAKLVFFFLLKFLYNLYK